MTRKGVVVTVSPVEHLSAELGRTGGPATLREIPFRALVELRIDEDHVEAFAPRAAQFLGCELPETGQATGTGAPYVLWSGPGWYLIDDEPGTAPGLEAGLLADCGGAYGHAIDLSAARTILELSGPRAAQVLRHGCSIDLHPRAFGPGRCARTDLARAQVTLHQSGPETYRILVRCSFADYLARWLLDAMIEYLAVIPEH
jgi:sarcosine oxidase subunit gamma